MAEADAKTCAACGRDAQHLSRERCANCYRIWQRDHHEPNAVCGACARAYYRRPGASTTGATCSRACYVTWKRGRNARNETTDGANLVERACACCGRTFTVEKRRVDKGFGRYCSLACNAARRQAPRLLMSCEWCRAAFELRPSRVFASRSRFCTRDCWRAACRAGKATREQDRNDRAYRRFRDALLAQATACEECGATADLVLHHRIRTRERPDLLFEVANLEVLCRGCHTRHHSLRCHHQPEVAA